MAAMKNLNSRWLKVVGSTLVATVLGVPTVIAQNNGQRGDDVLEQTKRAQIVAGQKVESQIRAALIEAQRLAATDPVKAVERLYETFLLLDGDNVLPESRREALKRVVKDRVRVIEAEKTRSTTEAGLRNNATAFAETRRGDEGRQSAEQADITRTLATIRELREAGKFDEAKRLSEELFRRQADVPAVRANRQTTTAADNFAEERKVRAERERKIAAADLDLKRSATPVAGDVEFPKDWAERTKNRNKSTLTAKEKSIMQALAAPVSVTFKNSRFEDVLNYIQTVTGQPIVIDKNALDEAAITYETPVSVNSKGVAVRTLLRQVLSSFNMTYVIKDETIQVVTATRAKDMMITRSYYLGDLIAGKGAGAFFFGAGAEQVQAAQNASVIMDMIQNSVDTGSWQKNGGAATITYSPATLSIVIKQSAEIHGMLGSSLVR
jgi:hypothetical protein